MTLYTEEKFLKENLGPESDNFTSKMREISARNQWRSGSDLLFYYCSDNPRVMGSNPSFVVLFIFLSHICFQIHVRRVARS